MLKTVAKAVSDWGIAEVLALQEQMDFAERGPIGRLASPALAHQIVNVSRAMLRTGKRDARRRRRDDPLSEALQPVHHRLVTHLLERPLACHH